MNIFNVCNSWMNFLEPQRPAIKGITPQMMNKASRQEEELALHAAELKKERERVEAEEEMQKNISRLEDRQRRLEITAMEHKKHARLYADKYRALKESDPDRPKYQQMARQRLNMFNQTVESIKRLDIGKGNLVQIHHSYVTSQQNIETAAALKAAGATLKKLIGETSADSMDDTYAETQAMLETAAEFSVAVSQPMGSYGSGKLGDATLDEELNALFESEDITITPEIVNEPSVTAAALSTVPVRTARAHRRADSVQVPKERVAVVLHK
jgi:hypothetical protein